ncbi:hypothetical protein D1AOALGA4SA_111 [Olavius algarvensis Delta 1 endosymbiont]|nr:hypothetical protein D1AOALGA4SA_111 [Olavius algarvensis Delta 1 endosymbiont]
MSGVSVQRGLWPEKRPVWSIEPAHKLKIDQNKLQNCRSNILNLVNVL